MSAISVSKIKLVLEIKEKSKINCELKRHLSPRTIGIILRSLPLEGNAHYLGKNIIYFETLVESGIERSRKSFKKGEIAFLPTSGSICFFIEDSSPGKAMTPIGKITSEIDQLKIAKSGDVLSLYADSG